LSEVMLDSHAHNAEMKLEDVRHAGTRAIITNARNAHSRDREE
jgi:hypothetical protein